MGKMFQLMMFIFLENEFNLCIFTRSPIKTPGRIFLKSVSPKTKEMEKTMICFMKIQSENIKIPWNIILLIFCMIYNFSKCEGFTGS